MKQKLVNLERDLKLWVRKQIGPLATPDLNSVYFRTTQKLDLERL